MIQVHCLFLILSTVSYILKSEEIYDLRYFIFQVPYFKIVLISR